MNELTFESNEFMYFVFITSFALLDGFKIIVKTRKFSNLIIKIIQNNKR